jgi:pimeloyl-ACP methyl ester carboxylesterase
MGLLLGACSAGSSPSVAPTSTSLPGSSGTPAATPSPTAAQMAAVSDGAVAAATDATGVEWLCRPGQVPDPCDDSLTTTVVPESGPNRVERAPDAVHPAIDCFYVYPTVSGQSGANANLAIDPAETAVAQYQASRFSQECRVFAPIYPQLTLKAIATASDLTGADLTKAYDGVVAAWEDYLAHYNDGRGVVVIGHSQGAAMLIALLRQKVDADATVRRHLVSAIILGGNVTVPIGKTVGGSFQHIPACASTVATGCVIAYSSFDQQPPSNSLFGRPGAGVSAMIPGAKPPAAGLQVLCVNPASPAGGVGPLLPFFPSAETSASLGANGASTQTITTPWVSQPGLYTGRCMYEDGASWLQVSGPVQPGDPRRIVMQTIGPTWGLHLVDVNIALGNLVSIVGDEARAYAAQG